MLPQVLIDEIFNIKYHVSEQALDYISDELYKFQCVVSYIEDNDHAVTIYFNRKTMPLTCGELRIDRITKNFQIVGACNGYMLPIEGDWPVIMKYLQQLTSPP